jgi:RNA polymerase sigma-70 factor, ECF subfamily
VPTVVGGADPGAAEMEALYDEHAAALWRYAVRSAGDASRAEDVVQESLLWAWQHPQVVGGAERSARAWLFTVACNMIIDERRSAGFRHVASPPDHSSTSEQVALHEVDAALNRLLIADTMAQLSAEYWAVMDRSCYRGWTTALIAADLRIAEGTVKSQLHYAARALRLTLQKTGVP